MAKTATTTPPVATMDTTIGDFDATTAPPSVPVTFVYMGVTHERSVNACLDSAGAYDADATTARVGQVGDGVKYNIEIGLVKNAPPPPPPLTLPEPAASETETETIASGDVGQMPSDITGPATSS